MLLHKESSLALGNAWWGTMAFSKPKEFMKYELTFPHWSIGKRIPFLLMCKHLIREYLTLSSYEMQKSFLSVSLWVEMSFTEGETETKREEAREKQRGTCSHLCGSVWSLKGASPTAAWVRALVRCSLPFWRCFNALIWLLLVRSTEDACSEMSPADCVARCRVLTCLKNEGARLLCDTS